MVHKFDDNISVTNAYAPQVATAIEKTGSSVDMAKWNNYAAICQLKATAAFAGDVVCVIAESTDGSTWSNTYLGTVTLSSSTVTDAIDVVEVRAEQMSDDYRYLRVELTPADGTGCVIAASNVRFNPRYAAP